MRTLVTEHFVQHYEVACCSVGTRWVPTWTLNVARFVVAATTQRATSPSRSRTATKFVCASDKRGITDKSLAARDPTSALANTGFQPSLIGEGYAQQHMRHDWMTRRWFATSARFLFKRSQILSCAIA